MSDGECRICGKRLKSNTQAGNQSHAGKHCREFERDTEYSKHTDYELIVAFYRPEEAANWAVEIMEQLKDAGKIPKNGSLEDFCTKSTENNTMGDVQSN